MGENTYYALMSPLIYMYRKIDSITSMTTNYYQ